jgi:alpha-L-fucosidase
MRSIILTVKHHESFCLWDRKQNEDVKDVQLLLGLREKLNIK